MVRGGQLVGSRGFGDANDQGEPANQDTLYGVGSLIKSLTAVAVLQLRDRGLLELDAPVRRYLPWFWLATPAVAEVTVRHLLTHTSGIPPSATMVVWQTPDRIRPSLEEGVRALARVVRTRPLANAGSTPTPTTTSSA